MESVDNSGAPNSGLSQFPCLARNADVIAYSTNAAISSSPSDANNTNDVYVRVRSTGLSYIASANGATVGNGFSAHCSISDDGRFVAFASDASNLNASDTDSLRDVYVKDIQSGSIACVSLDVSGVSGTPAACIIDSLHAISGDGSLVVFSSRSTTLYAGLMGTTSHVYLYDAGTGSIDLLSRVGSTVGNADSSEVSISPSGQYVTFISRATNLVGSVSSGTTAHVYLLDRQTGTLTVESVDSTGTIATGDSARPDATDTGPTVVFHSAATNLVSGDTNGFLDVFVRDVSTNTTTRASVDVAGGEGDHNSYYATLSADARFVAFASSATDLVGSDTNSKADIFLHDRLTGSILRMSVDPTLAEANLDSFYSTVNASGSLVVFDSYASNLDPTVSDVNGNFGWDVYARERDLPQTTFCFGDGTGPTCPCGNGNAGAGCNNSASTGGGLLGGTGLASVTTDWLTLEATNIAHSAGTSPLAYFIQSSTSQAHQFHGDGFLCLQAPLVRLGTVTASSMTARYGYGVAGTNLISVQGSISPGTTYYYQVEYRDPDLILCPSSPATFNWTNAMTITWFP